MKTKKHKTWIQEIDKTAFICKIPDMFHLSCCDCGLRHQVFIEKASKNKIRMGLVRDDYATKKFNRLEKYENKKDTKHIPDKKK